MVGKEKNYYFESNLSFLLNRIRRKYNGWKSIDFKFFCTERSKLTLSNFYYFFLEFLYIISIGNSNKLG